MRVTIANVLTGLSVTLLSLIALAILVSLAVQYRRRHNTRHPPIRVSQQPTQDYAQRASNTWRGDTTLDLENGIVEKSDDCNTANANSNCEASSVSDTALQDRLNRSRTPSMTAPIPKPREMRLTLQLNGIPFSPESPNSTSINTDTSTTASIDSNTTTSDSGLPSLSLLDKDAKFDIPWHTDVEKLELRNDLVIAVDGRRSSGESNASASEWREKAVVLGMDMLGIGACMNGSGNGDGTDKGNGVANDNETNKLKIKIPQKIRWSFFSRQEFAA